MSMPANIRISAQFPFPASVSGAAPVKLTKQNGVYTIGLDPASLATIPAVPPTSYILVWDPILNTWSKAPAATVIPPAVPGMRTPAFNANLPILTTDVEVGINTVTAAVHPVLPDAAAWVAINTTGVDLTLLDFTGNADVHNITPVLSGANTFLQGITPVLTQKFGSIRLRPSGSPINGWYVRGVG